MICRSNNIYIYIYIYNVENIAIPHIVMSISKCKKMKIVMVILLKKPICYIPIPRGYRWI